MCLERVCLSYLCVDVVYCYLCITSFECQNKYKNSEKNTVIKTCEVILAEQKVDVEHDSMSPGPNSAALRRDVRSLNFQLWIKIMMHSFNGIELARFTFNEGGLFVCFWYNSPPVGQSFLIHTQRRTTVGRNRLDE
jgi:hypothetical protein